MSPAVAAAALAAVSAALMLPGLPRLPARRPSSSALRLLLPFALLAAPLVMVTVGSGLRPAHVGLAAVAILATVGGLHLVAGAGQAREAGIRRQQVVDYCEALSGELRAGQPVVRAVQRAVTAWPETESVVAAVRIGADVPMALRRLGASPGTAGVTRLAEAWELCAATGTGLAFAVEQVLETARSEQATARLVQGELASARATARLVTALPVVVLLAAEGIGSRPWWFLFSTVPGVTCLGFGVALALLGLRWIDRIATAATAGGR